MWIVCVEYIWGDLVGEEIVGEELVRKGFNLKVVFKFSFGEWVGFGRVEGEG